MYNEKLCIKRLRNLRKERGFSQVDIAGMIGVHHDVYGRIERGAAMSSNVICRLAEVYGVSTDYLLGGDNNPKLNIDDGLVTKFHDRVASDSKDYQEMAIVMESDISSFVEQQDLLQKTEDSIKEFIYLKIANVAKEFFKLGFKFGLQLKSELASE